jgi:hypothetical protein
MADLVMVGVLVGFVLLCLAYVAWCSHIVSAAEQAEQGR